MSAKSIEKGRPVKRRDQCACHMALTSDPPSSTNAIVCTLAPFLSKMKPKRELSVFSRIDPVTGKIARSKA